MFAGIQVLSFTVYVFTVATLPAIELTSFTLWEYEYVVPVVAELLNKQVVPLKVPPSGHE